MVKGSMLQCAGKRVEAGECALLLWHWASGRLAANGGAKETPRRAG